MDHRKLKDLRICVVGPGALGCLLGASFSLAGFQTSLFDYNPDRTALLRRKGITLIGQGGQQRVHVPVYCQPNARLKPDLLFLCVKSAKVDDALKHLLPMLHAGNLLIALQNGIGHLEVLQKNVGTNYSWAAGVTAMGANLRAEGEVVFAGSGLSRFGFLGPASDTAGRLLRQAVAALKKSGFEAEITDNPEQRIWEKLMINVGINALTAIHDLENGRLLDDPAITATMKAAIAEAETVAKTMGLDLPDDSFARAVAVCRATAANLSSMLQDVRNRKPTEIEAINGAIVRLADGLQIEVPVNRRLTEQVKKLERSYR